MRQVVQTLQLALEKEKTKVKDLKEQVRALRQTSGYVLCSLFFKLKCQLHNIFIFAFK